MLYFVSRMRPSLVVLACALAAAPQVSIPAARAEAPRRLTVVTPPPVERSAAISPVIYLERCIGGCRVTSMGASDATRLESAILDPGFYTVTEFQNTAGQTGAAADAEWAMVVACMKEVYSPFAVEVTDRKPTSGTYHLAMIAGDPPDVGLPLSVLGLAPLAGDCSALDNTISFSFSNAHNQADVLNRVFNICWTAAQESAHAFGLDHQFEFVKDGRSTCNDPMTYRMDCGGQKFFRNFFARCGEDAVRECRCGPTQSSHKKLLSVFGAGTPSTGTPTVNVTDPPPGATELPDRMIAVAGARRGVAKVQLFLNGFPYVTLPGQPFGPAGQNASAYLIDIPASTPDSIYDVFVRASDDLGVYADTTTVTLTKGGPCQSSDACLPEQRCEAGRCLWDPPVGELGDACTYPQFCKSLICRGTADEQICTQECEPEDPTGCPSGMGCFEGICFFADEGGCCSTGRGGGWAPSALLAVLIGLVLGRRRR